MSIYMLRRVAGNVVNDFVLGSILFAVQHLGVRLVVVLGHSRCSIVASAVQSWVRHQSAKKLNPSARAMAEGVQRALADGPLGVTDLPAPNIVSFSGAVGVLLELAMEE